MIFFFITVLYTTINDTMDVSSCSDSGTGFPGIRTTGDPGNTFLENKGFDPASTVLAFFPPVVVNFSRFATAVKSKSDGSGSDYFWDKGEIPEFFGENSWL
jgi:hypothetical protein